MATGTVKWFNEEKRFGFITPDEGGQDLFVHQTGLVDGARSLADGAKVEFESEEGPQGPEGRQRKDPLASPRFAGRRSARWPAPRSISAAVYLT